jgi:hypothetical protein
LLWNEKVAWKSLAEFQQDGYQWLMDQGYLTVEDGYVLLKNEKEILVFRELYENEVISYWHYSEDSRAVIDKLYEQGCLEFGCSLLSNPEIDYFNYYLNKLEFTNGADLRNKYAHGSHHYGEETMKSDYYRLLILLALLEWKIIDDIILTESNR